MQDGPQTLTIAAVRLSSREDDHGHREERLEVAFDTGQRLTLNRVNGNALVEAFGPETDDWVGQAITAYWDPDVEFRGRRCGGVRLRVGRGPASATRPSDRAPWEDDEPRRPRVADSRERERTASRW